MSLLTRIASPETILSFEGASSNRHREGRYLLQAEHSFWAIYTLGYVVEMSLKIAYVRVCGLGPRVDIKTCLREAPTWAQHLGRQGKPRNLHDLMFWFELILLERQFLRRPLRPACSQEFAVRIQQVAKHWREDLRYFPAVAARSEVTEVAAAVSWIVQHRALLWR